MPAARTRDEYVFNTIEDDDDMPPLVDNPNPSPMMYTFAANMTPMAYGSPPASMDAMPDNTFDEVTLSSPPDSPLLSPIRQSHGRRRDASYIPRPPNAFILFRSSFVKAQRVPGKIEGNHSTLSKIVGMYWKNLPPEEREVWEKKAQVAQADHRRKYPDWRFRPANGIAKVKDGPADARRRNRGQGRGESEEELRSREKRCAKIVDLLGEGKVGSELAAAVEEYDRKLDTVERRSRDPSPKPAPRAQQPRSTALTIKQEAEKLPLPDNTFKVPVAALSKRSSSAPAAPGRLPALGLPSLESCRGLLPPLNSPFTAYICAPPKGLTGLEEAVSATRGINVDAMPRPKSASDKMMSQGDNHQDEQQPDHKPLRLLTASPDVSTPDSLAYEIFTVNDDGNPRFAEHEAGVELFRNEQVLTSDMSQARKEAVIEDPLPYLSSYSTLKGWAGGVNSARCSPRAPHTKLLQYPDTTSIMSAAFEAASTYVPHEEPYRNVVDHPGPHEHFAAERYLHEYSRGKQLMNILDLEAADSISADAAYFPEYMGAK